MSILATVEYAGSERLLALMFRALEHALGDAKDGLLLTFAMVVVDGQRGLVRFVGDAHGAIASARDHVSGSVRTDRWVVAYDGWATFPGEEPCRAVVIEAGELGEPEGWRLVQRYERQDPQGPFLLVGLPAWLGRTTQLLGPADYH